MESGDLSGAANDQNRIEQLMVNMLDERDKLLEQLQVTSLDFLNCSSERFFFFFHNLYEITSIRIEHLISKNRFIRILVQLHICLIVIYTTLCNISSDSLGFNKSC